jgi:hypothetical protein
MWCSCATCAPPWTGSTPDLPEAAREQAVEKLTRVDFARSLVQHNKEFHAFIRNGVPVEWRDASGETRHARAMVIDFRNAANNRFPRRARAEDPGDCACRTTTGAPTWSASSTGCRWSSSS